MNASRDPLRRTPARSWAGAIVLALAFFPASDAVADSTASLAIDSTAMSRLRAAVGRNTSVRVTTGFERYALWGVSLDAEGVRYREAFRARTADLPPSPIPWSRVERLEMASSNVGNGVMIGVAAGLAAGVIWNASDPPKSQAGFLRFGPTASGISLARTLGAMAAGAVLGAAVGNSIKRWRIVYPVPER